MLGVGIVLLMAGSICSADQEGKTYAEGKIAVIDPALEKILDPSATIEQLGEGFEWAEGPAWNKKEGFLVFSDIPRNSVMQYRPGKGVSLYFNPSGYSGGGAYSDEPGSNGLIWNPRGELLLMQHGNRQVAKRADGDQFLTVADRFGGKKFNSPNDGVLKSNGDLYFTDPPYGLPKQADDPTRELDFCGVYRVTPGGTVTLLTKEMTRPNGIAFSPDEKFLYVAQSDPQLAIWKKFDVLADGTIAHGKVLFDATASVGKKKGLPDGMKVDQSGHLWATGPGGVLILTPEGKHLGTIETGQATANCAFGGDGSVLYITADMYLLRVKTKTKGIGF
ncbi:SMP-30/gluconolactonase/LRE family protein [bacterium]|nr:SMP-30/gluconolactonase/LRE family protein [bacterium]